MPSTIVKTMNTMMPLREFICAACTAIAMVRLLPINTAVLIVPSGMSRWWLADAKACGYQPR